jgi:cysteinyl-tRNA synthetase
VTIARKQRELEERIDTLKKLKNSCEEAEDAESSLNSSLEEMEDYFSELSESMNTDSNVDLCISDDKSNVEDWLTEAEEELEKIEANASIPADLNEILLILEDLTKRIKLVEDFGLKDHEASNYDNAKTFVESLEGIKLATAKILAIGSPEIPAAVAQS